MIVSIIICFLISFILRRGSVRIPYRNNEQSLLQINNPLPRRNLKIMDRWVQKYNGPDDENCVICCNEFKAKMKVIKLPECSHFYHKKCIISWFLVNPICPICKKDYSVFVEP
jgi:HRD ubiquitin ligase complex, ER membrane component